MNNVMETGVVTERKKGLPEQMSDEKVIIYVS